MNNFRNYPGSESHCPANKVAEYAEKCGSDERRGKEEEKRGGRGVYRGILDPGNRVVSTRSVRKKRSRESGQEKKKGWKSGKESPWEKSLRKPGYLEIIESQLAKAKAKGKAKGGGKILPQSERRGRGPAEVLRSEGLWRVGGEEKEEEEGRRRGRILLEGRKGGSKEVVGGQKGSGESWQKQKKSEMGLKCKGSIGLTEQLVSQKSSEKGSKGGEVAGMSSETGKRHINDILKNHAQKVQSSSTKAFPVKEYSFQGVPELLKKMQGASSAAAAAGKNEEVMKSEGGKHEKVEEVKFKETKGSKEVKHGEELSEEKKKVGSGLLRGQQLSEQERKSKASCEDPLVREKEVRSSEGGEEEKKSERRTTYTDRLLLLRMIGKDLEEKKQAAAAKALEKGAKETKEAKEGNSNSKPSTGEKQENLHKRNEVVPLNRQLNLKISLESPAKETTLGENKELVPMKDGKPQEGEHIYKTKQTRSAELRDLVTQAIKEHKIFCIFDNHWYIVRPVREELLSRGWLEVVPDRRFIPRRRPPPMGPTFERDKTVTERNCNTLEAILTAKENFADELQETVSKAPSFRWTLEKPKPLPAPQPNLPNKKFSDDSLNEAPSQFRIIPPTTERKKNNIEIREFTVKYHAILAKGFDREREIKKLRERERNAKSLRRERTRSPPNNLDKQTIKPNEKPAPESTEHIILPGSKSFQEILDSIRENKKTIVQAATEIKIIEGKAGPNPELGILFEAAANGAKELMTTEPPKTQDKMVGTSQEKPVYVNGKAIFTETEIKSMSKIIQANNARIHFMWLSIKPAIHLKCFNYSPEIVNKFQRTTFCTKIGLWSHLNNIQWYAHEVHYPAKSPRMYNTGEADDLQAFFEDFQMTACIGLLKWLSDTFFERGLKAIQAKRGKVPLKAFEFAIKQCERYIKFKENEDLGVLEESRVHNDEWNTFLQWFYIITNDHGKLQETSSAQLMVVYTKAVETLKAIRRYWPEIDIDGRLNIWIMKPYCASCGRGIFMTNNVYYIGQHTKYIVQKYIEKPLLIYNTKFDIRQWFMITKLTPLEIWMYKECYLRFCTQPFALRNLHESVHLSNNSVQRKYISFRDPSLPDQNMWDSNTFQLYLKTIGQPTAWDEIIYPGMKDAIVSTMLASQDTFDGPRKSWFEVYGADFMLSANLKEGPWLIEINENPAMDPSTKVTARLCPQMLRDVIKVVVDKRANKNASTGQWELIYRQNYSPSFGTVDLDIKGKKIARVSHGAKSNIPQHPSSSPVYMKGYNANDADSDRLYEFVKTYEKRQNNRGDATDFGKARGGAKKSRKNPSCRVSPKRRGSVMESSERAATSDFPFQVMGYQKATGSQDPSDYRAEKYKFTKFYNV